MIAVTGSAPNEPESLFVGWNAPATVETAQQPYVAQIAQIVSEATAVASGLAAVAVVAGEMQAGEQVTYIGDVETVYRNGFARTGAEDIRPMISIIPAPAYGLQGQPVDLLPPGYVDPVAALMESKAMDAAAADRPSPAELAVSEGAPLASVDKRTKVIAVVLCAVIAFVFFEGRR